MERSEKMRMLYLISGRSAASWSIGRKIPEVVNAFRQHAETTLLCGGDIKGGVGHNNASHTMTSNSEYHAKWYRKNAFVNFFTRSYSEIKDLFHCRETYRYLKKQGDAYDLVWERSSRLHWAGFLLARRLHVPCVLEWKDHLVDYRLSLLHPLATYIERWKNKKADYIAIESQVLKDALIADGIDGDKIFLTYNAVDPSQFSKDIAAGNARRVALGFAETDVIVGYVGTYAFYHDSERLIRTANVLKQRGLTHIKWLLIGDGKDKLKCEQLAKELGLLSSTIVMLPFQKKEEVPSYLSAMDITVLPGSTDIICPIKVMEYMAAESVVLVPDYECNREVINGENGLLFTPFDENSMADQIERVAADGAFRKEMGRKARQYVIDHLTWDKTYGAALRDILSKVEEKESI